MAVNVDGGVWAQAQIGSCDQSCRTQTNWQLGSQTGYSQSPLVHRLQSQVQFSNSSAQSPASLGTRLPTGFLFPFHPPWACEVGDFLSCLWPKPASPAPSAHPLWVAPPLPWVYVHPQCAGYTMHIWAWDWDLVWQLGWGSTKTVAFAAVSGCLRGTSAALTGNAAVSTSAISGNFLFPCCPVPGLGLCPLAPPLELSQGPAQQLRGDRMVDVIAKPTRRQSQALRDQVGREARVQA